MIKVTETESHMAAVVSKQSACALATRLHGSWLYIAGYRVLTIQIVLDRGGVLEDVLDLEDTF